MNNTTVEEIKIKLRGDHVFDVYVNKRFIASRGSRMSAFAAAMEYMDFLDNEANIKENKDNDYK